MDDQQSLADGIEQCKPLVLRYVDGFDDATRTKQTVNQPNHVAWCLGHCALTMHRAAQTLDDGDLPDSCFLPDQFSGDKDRFGAESVSLGSAPRPDPDLYPTLDRCVTIYESACDRLAEAVRGAEAQQLDQIVDWGAARTTCRELMYRMIFHNGTHCGQIIDLRRGLEMPNIIR